MSIKKESKAIFILGIIGVIASIVSIIMIITNPNVLTYKDFFARGLVSILILITSIIRIVKYNAPAVSKKSKKDNV